MICGGHPGCWQPLVLPRCSLLVRTSGGRGALVLSLRFYGLAIPSSQISMGSSLPPLPTLPYTSRTRYIGSAKQKAGYGYEIQYLS